jgi:hypothetical protein
MDNHKVARSTLVWFLEEKTFRKDIVNELMPRLHEKIYFIIFGSTLKYTFFLFMVCDAMDYLCEMEIKKQGEMLESGTLLPLMEAFYTIQGEGLSQG